LILPWMLALGGLYTLPVTLSALILLGPKQPFVAFFIPGIVQFLFNTALVARDLPRLPNPDSAPRFFIGAVGLIFVPGYLGWRADLLKTGVAPAIISQVIFIVQLSYILGVIIIAHEGLTAFVGVE